METKKQIPTQSKHDQIDEKLADALGIPKGDVLIRKIAGPDGINHYLGQVKRGRVYCLSIEQAAHLIHPSSVEFELVFKADRRRIEPASKRPQDTVQTKSKDNVG